MILIGDWSINDLSKLSLSFFLESGQVAMEIIFSF